MTKTLVSHSPACDMDQFRHDLFPYKRDQAARSRRRAEREETRRLAAQALLELAETRRLATASAAMAAVIAQWSATEITIWNEDHASWEIGQAGRAAGLTHAERTRVKDAVIGRKCPSCLSRLCQHTPQECERRLWAAEIADYEYDWSRDTR